MFDTLRATGIVLRKQHLVPLTYGSKPSDVAGIVADICGLEWDSSEVENPDWVLRNRFTEYNTDWLGNAIKDRTLVEFRLMRGCEYIVPSQELPYYFAATRKVTEKMIQGHFGSRSANELREREKTVLSALRQHAPVTQRELGRRTKLIKNALSEAILNLHYLGYAVKSSREGKQDLWHLTDEWLPSLNLGAVTEDEGQEHLTVKFFRAAGPSTVHCLRRWTGWELESTTRNVDNLIKREVLALVGQTPRQSESMIALKKDLNMFNGYLERDSAVRLLSPFDPYLRMREPLLWLGDFSPTVAGVYSLVMGGAVVAAFRLKRQKEILSVDVKRVFQKALLSARSAEIRREIELHAASERRRVRLSPKVEALL